ncbi:unnamed protein product [Ambrosiozyma monospora]|uniref:Unnamed protein product n=1 Tax=Ambrosiozyma monospora TaxID=43982 RepID=A0A9W7DIG3_AMBMO|nr:unnamed protein product [Ambrosiozyma monospora]
MSQGTVYLNVASPRSSLFKDLVEYLKLDIKVSDNSDPEYIKNFPLKKLPTFSGPKGSDYHLHEAIALLIYIISLKSPSDNYNFYGSNVLEQGKVWKWVSFVNSEMISTLVYFIYPVIGNLPYTKEGVAKAYSDLEMFADLFEEQLKETKYLATNDRPTLADIWAVQSFRWAFQTAFDKAWLNKRPVLKKWFREICDTDPIASLSLKGFEPVDVALKNEAPKKKL